MDLLEALIRAVQLIFASDPRILEVTLRSLFVSGSATLIAMLWGVPIAALIGTVNFRGKFLVKTFFNTLIGIPTVALGFFLFLIFSKETGPLGFLGILYTPTAIIIGEAILVFPIVVSFAASAIEAVDPDIARLAKTLGASESQARLAVLREALDGIMLSGLTSFNRAIGELGIAVFVGGFIAGVTELLTTGIKLEIDTNNLEVALALALILLALVFAINLALNLVQRRRRK